MEADAREACLIEAGMSRNEAKIYVMLLERGPSIASMIAEQAKLHRANVYEALAKLHGKGLVAVFERDEKKLYEASNPSAILNLMKERQQRVMAVLPQLQLAHKISIPSSGEAKVFEGIQAMCNVLEDFLQYGEPIYVYGIPKAAPEMLRFFIMQYHKRRIAKRVKMYHIYNYDAKERISYLNTVPYTFAKALPQNFNSIVSTNICGEQVAFFLFGERPYVIQIKQRDIAEAYKRYFHLLWKQARIPK